MKVKELMGRLEGFDPEMDIKILSNNHASRLPVTEIIADVKISEYPCPSICILIEGA